MAHDLVPSPPRNVPGLLRAIPPLFANAGKNAAWKYIEFFTATIRNRNTRDAYARAVRQFAAWCERKKLGLADLRPFFVAAYIEELGKKLAKPTVKQHLAAIRMLFDFLVVGQIIPMNPASSVRGPKYVVKRGKTPVLTAAEARRLLQSIDTSTVVGLRDRAIIAVMVYSFARVSAVVGMNIEDYFPQGKRFWFRLHEKGGKQHEVPVHHKAEFAVDQYVAAAGIGTTRDSPLFRSVNRGRELTSRRMTRREVLAMIKRRSRQVGLPGNICCHTFRATGITVYLKSGGLLEHAQTIAAHESPRTTKLYDRTKDDVNLDEIERIAI